MADVAQEGGAISSRHMNVAEDEIGQVLSRLSKAGDAGIGFDDMVTFANECHGEYSPQLGLVIDNENRFHSGKEKGRSKSSRTLFARVEGV